MTRDSRDRTGRRLLALLAVAVAFTAGLASLLLLLPFEASWQATGTLRYRRENPLVADFDGVVTALIEDGGRELQAGDSILLYENRDDLEEAELARLKIGAGKRESERLQALFDLGQIDRNLLLKHSEVLGELRWAYRRNRENVLRARMPGRIHFHGPPSRLAGTYVTRGTPLGVVYSEGPRILEVPLDLGFADKIPLGARIIAYARTVSQPFSLRLHARVVSRTLDLREHRLILHCEPDTAAPPARPGPAWESLEVGVPFRVRILADRAPLLERLFRK